MPDEQTRMTAWVHGHVQGVGFRYWTKTQALELGLLGYAANQPDGRVRVVVEGDQVGSVLLEGRGAGGGPTASAVVADIIDIARGEISWALLRGAVYATVFLLVMLALVLAVFIFAVGPAVFLMNIIPTSVVDAVPVTRIPSTTDSIRRSTSIDEPSGTRIMSTPSSAGAGNGRCTAII